MIFLKMALILIALITTGTSQAAWIGSITNRANQELTLELQLKLGTEDAAKKIITLSADQSLALDGTNTFYKIPEENPLTKNQFSLCFTLARHEQLQPGGRRTAETFTYVLFRRLAPSQDDHNDSDDAEVDDLGLDYLVANKMHNGTITPSLYWDDGEACICDLIIQENGNMALVWRT